MKQIYPRMLYPKGGDKRGEPIIVQDKDGEEAAKKDGYAIYCPIASGERAKPKKPDDQK